MELTKMIYQITNDLPNDEKFEMISQLKRVSVPANIVEGAARQTRKNSSNFYLRLMGLSVKQIRLLNWHLNLIL